MLRQSAITRDAWTGASWQKLFLMGALVALPVPALTAGGLAVPLPSAVYRLAVGLATRTQEVVDRLAGVDAAAPDDGVKLRVGVIKLSAAELAAAGSTQPNATAPAQRPTGHGSPATGGEKSPGENQSAPIANKPPASTVPADDSSASQSRPAPPPAANPPPPPPPPAAPPPPPPPVVKLPVEPPQLPQAPQLPEVPDLPVAPPSLPVVPH